MTTTTKTNAREQLIAFILSQGWELDPNQTVWDGQGSWYSSQDRVQDPHAFRKPAADGGTWTLSLDYNVRTSYRGVTDNRLRGVTLRLRDAEGRLAQIGKNSYNDYVRLDPRTGDNLASSLTYQLWAVLGGTNGTNSLRQRIELLAAAPATALWLAEENRQARLERLAEQRRQREEEAKARKRPLDITVGRSEWDRQTDALYRAVNALHGAHGLTPLAEKIAEAEAALAALRAALPVAVH